MVGRCTRRPRSIRGVPPAAIPELAAIVAEEIIARAQLLSRHPKLGRPISTREEYRQIVMRVLGGAHRATKTRERDCAVITVPGAALQQFDALMTRRRQLLDILTAKGNRLEHAAAPIRREITQPVRWLEPHRGCRS